MRGVALAAVVALLLPAACGQQEAVEPRRPVVQWRSVPPGVEFPIPREAQWAPVYQRLRCKLEERAGSGYRWTCFSGGDFDGVLRFYARKLGVRPEDVTVRRRPAAEHFHTVRSVAAGLGHRVPEGDPPRGTVRIAQLWPMRRLPVVVLESPWLDLDTGRWHRGTLISMRWRPRKEVP